MKNIGLFVDKLIAYLVYLLVGIAGVSFILILIGITTNVLGRWLFNNPLLFVNELTGYLFVAIVYGGFAYAAREHAHISADVVVKRLSKKVQNRLEVVTLLVALAMVAIYFWFSWGLFVGSIQRDARAVSILETPLWIPQTLLWLGLLVLCLHIASCVVKKFIVLQKGQTGE